MKIVIRFMSILLSVTILVVSLWPACKASAEELKVSNTRIIELTEDSYLTIQESLNTVTSEYYENGIRLQKAVLTKANGEIDYQEFCGRKIKIGVLDFNGLAKVIKSEKYNVRDFYEKKEINTNGNLKGTNQIFSYLTSKIFENSGITYYRYLYGYWDIKNYYEGNWAFKAGTALAVISAALSFAPHAAARLISQVAAVGAFL